MEDSNSNIKTGSGEKITTYDGCQNEQLTTSVGIGNKRKRVVEIHGQEDLSDDDNDDYSSSCHDQEDLSDYEDVELSSIKVRSLPPPFHTRSSVINIETPRSSIEFGRDTNSVDYFMVRPLDVRYASENEAAASYNDDSSQSGTNANVHAEKTDVGQDTNTSRHVTFTDVNAVHRDVRTRDIAISECRDTNVVQVQVSSEIGGGEMVAQLSDHEWLV
ncbi:hypothetical protein Tco_0017546 [Tanacetum coccineum]